MDLTPTDRELQALQVLWNQGEATVRDVWKALRGPNDDLPYTTVLSLMQVMQKKGLVGHRERGRAYLYFANVQSKSVLERLAAGFLDRVFGGAVDEYLVHALAGRRPSDEELDRLEKLIAEAKARSRRKRPNKR